MAHFIHTKTASYVRSLIFGVEDSLVSTVGLLSGIAISSQHTVNTILATGIIYLLVEGFSMAAGAFLSERAAEDFLTDSKEPPLIVSIQVSAVMFISFIAVGFIPLFPYLIFRTHALVISVILSLITLFLIGITSGKFARRHIFRNGLEMLIVGGAAIGVGILAGKFL